MTQKTRQGDESASSVCAICHRTPKQNASQYCKACHILCQALLYVDGIDRATLRSASIHLRDTEQLHFEVR